MIKDACFYPFFSPLCWKLEPKQLGKEREGNRRKAVQTFPVHSPNRSASFSHSDSGTCGMEASPISFARASMARMDLKK